MSLPRWWGMLQKMGVPAVGEFKGTCRTFQGFRPRPGWVFLQSQSLWTLTKKWIQDLLRMRQSSLRIFFFSKSRDSDACRKIPFKCTDAQHWGFLVADRVDKRGRCEWEQPRHRLHSSGCRIHRHYFISIISPLIGKTAAITSTLKDTSINIYHE